MRLLLFVCAAFALCACGPAAACDSLQVGAPSRGLPLFEYSLSSQGGIFDNYFGPMLSKGPPAARCCAWRAKGVTIGGCTDSMDCSGVTAQAFQLGRPYSASEHNGAYFCFATVDQDTIVSVWGLYQD